MTTNRGRVERRGTGWGYRVSYTQDGLRRHLRRQGFATMREAEKAMVATLAKIDAGHNLGTQNGTVDVFLRSWLDGYDASGSVKFSTQVATRLHVETYLIPRIGKLQMRQLRPARIAQLYVDLLQNGRTGGRSTARAGSGLSPKTVRNIAGTLHKALSDAVRLGVLPNNPADGVDLPRWNKPEMRVWTTTQVARFLDHAEQVNDPALALWRLLLVNGLRRGEVLGLRWDDVDLVEARVTVRLTRISTTAKVVTSTPKTQSGRRSVAIDPGTVTALALLKDAQEHAARMLGGWASDYVATDLDGRVIQPQTLTRRFAKATRAAGLPPIRLHDTRHTHVSHLIDAGVPIIAIAARVGHSRPSFTLDTYGHLLPHADRQASDAVASMIDAVSRAENGTRKGRAGREKDAQQDELDDTQHDDDRRNPLQINKYAIRNEPNNGADDGNRTP